MMLLRRLRQRAGRFNLQCAGTSATIATGGDRSTRRAQIAEVGSRLFGVSVASDNVIDETLERVSQVPIPETAAALRTALEKPAPLADHASVVAHPLAAWAEEAFGLTSEDGRLVRRPPISFADGVAALADATSLPPNVARRR